MELARGAAENAEEQRLSLDDITGAIVNTAFNLHVALGPGLLESVYEAVLARHLARQGFLVDRQRAVSFEYDGLRFEDAFRVDLLVSRSVVVEIKSVERALPVHSKQLLTYLRLLKLPVGLLINFGAPTLKAGVQRIVNRPATLRVSATPRESNGGLKNGLRLRGSATPPSMRRSR